MKFIAKTYEFFNRFVPTIENKSKHTYLYGLDDLLPNTNLRLINDCGVAKRCVRKKARYIQADGFSDEAAGKLQVNQTQTANKLLQQIASYAAYNEGFALQISRTADAKIAGVKCIPFQCVRKTTDGNFTYNPKRGQDDFREQQTTTHPPFNPALTVEQFKENLDKFKLAPEIFYVYEETADNPHYPVPDFNAGIEDIKTCIEISMVDLECVENGFMPSGILTTHEMDTETKGDDNQTPYERFVEEVKKFTGQTKNKEGKSGRFKLMHVMVSSLAEAPKLEKYDAKSILEASNTKRDIIAREVCRLFGVHPILVGFSDAQVLGNNQALSNVITDFNNYINPIQRMISDAFKVIYPLNEWGITQFNPITYIPPEVWAKMTDEEIRGVVGFEALETTTPTNEQKILDTLNSLSPLLSAEIVKRLPDQKLFELIGITAVTPPAPLPQPATNGVN